MPSINQLYQLRSISNYEDVLSWAHFCADCFSYKPNAPSYEYFLRHFNNDPRRDASLIRCLQYLGDDEPVIASSVRIFQRTISLGNGKTVEAGGIGEVCTSEEHRKRGLAKWLLHDAIDIMVNGGKMKCSLLHAGAALQPVYEKSGGYHVVKSEWSVLALNLQTLNHLNEDTSFTVRRASFPDDTERLQQIHKKYSEDRFAGCIIRTTEYWNEYLKHEIGDSLYVLTTSADSIVSWISIRPRNGRFQIRDFGVDLEECKSMNRTTAQILSRLLKASLEKVGTLDNQEATTAELHLPTIVVDEMRNQEDFCEESCDWVDWSTEIQVDDDNGWMYKTFGSEDDMFHVVNKMKIPHLIWPSDSF